MTEPSAKQRLSQRARLTLWLALSLTAAALLFFLLSLIPTEPSYQTRSLSSWIDELSPPIFAFNLNDGSSTPIFLPVRTTKERDALEAIRAIGTNALPYLANVVRQDDSRLKTKLLLWLNKQKFAKIRFPSADQRRAHAYAALLHLGYAAIPGWRDLLLDENLPMDRREIAALSLARLNSRSWGFPVGYTSGTPVAGSSLSPSGSLTKMDHEALWRVLSQALSSTNPIMRANVAFHLANLGTDAKDAVPILLQHVHDPDPRAREACLKALSRCEPDMALSLIRSVKYRSGPGRAGAAASLGFLKQRPEESIAILIEATHDPEPKVRETAISALSDFGPRASNAIPLLNACNDTNKIVRRAATNALAQIAPNKQSQ